MLERTYRLETASSRRRFPIVKKPVFERMSPGALLGYRRNQGAGTWVVKVPDPKRTNSYWTKAIGYADDEAPADGETILTYWQARERVQALASGDDTPRTAVVGRKDESLPGGITVRQAVERYLAFLDSDRQSGADARPRLNRYVLNGGRSASKRAKSNDPTAEAPPAAGGRGP